MARFNELVQPGITRPQTRWQRPIDLVHLARQTMGDWGLECEVLRMFEERARTYFARVEASTTIDELCTNLHSLRGAAAGIGAWTLVDLAGATEDDLRTGGAVNPERIDDLAIAVHEVGAYIADILKNEPA